MVAKINEIFELHPERQKTAKTFLRGHENPLAIRKPVFPFHAFQDSCCRMANSALCLYSHISSLFISFAGVAAMKGNAL
jgi:hypothetical protein